MAIPNEILKGFHATFTVWPIRGDVRRGGGATIVGRVT